MHPSRVRALYRRLQQANPHPTTELEHKTPFELLVAVMLSAHTTDKSVNTATRILFPLANTPQAILALDVEGVKPYIKTVGLYNTKAKNLIELCRRIVEQHGGEIPREREALEALPGVGRKTANIILNMVFGESTIAVDTHIFRVSNRTGLAEGKDPRVVEDELNIVTPDEYKKDAHHWLLLHGRYVCVARVPACPKCIIADLCEYQDKTPPKDLPKSDAPVAHQKANLSVARRAASPKADPPSARRAANTKADSSVARAAPKKGAKQHTANTAAKKVTRSSATRQAASPTADPLVARAAPSKSAKQHTAKTAASKVAQPSAAGRANAAKLPPSRARRG